MSAFVNPLAAIKTVKNPFTESSVVVPNPASGILRKSNKNNKNEKELQRLTNELIKAVEASNTDTILDLIDNKGADVNKEDNNGYTPLFIAIYLSQSKVVSLLIAHGVDVNKAAENGVTPLFIASSTGKVSIVDLLLKAGADVNADTGSGYGPPVDSGDFRGVTASDGITPLMAASDNGHITIVDLLLKAGADVNKERKQGGTAIYLASQNGHADIVRLLLAAGADVNKALDSGNTSLIIASSDGNTEIVRLLLAAGADVNKANNNGITSLSIASQNGHADVVRLLLAAGADASIKVNGHSLYNVAPQKIKNILTGKNNPYVVVPNPAMGISTGGGRRKSRNLRKRKAKRKTRHV
jgi:hypothetical protein